MLSSCGGGGSDVANFNHHHHHQQHRPAQQQQQPSSLSVIVAGVDVANEQPLLVAAASLLTTTTAANAGVLYGGDVICSAATGGPTFAALPSGIIHTASVSSPGDDVSAAIECPITDGYGYSLSSKMEPTTGVCYGCGGAVLDRFLLSVNDKTWHLDCLRCCQCCMPMDQCPSCFVKEERTFCKPCYTRQYGVKCAGCRRIIQPSDWVRRARQFVYHLACFSCDTCKRQLSTGEEFALQDCRLLCKQHYMELLEGDGHQKQKNKRVRTTFTEEQLEVLQAQFQIESNPDGQDLERIAQITGLSKRVTQVWFQNSRARQKKYQGSGGLMDVGCAKLGGGGVRDNGDTKMACEDEDDDEEDDDDDDGVSMSPMEPNGGGRSPSSNAASENEHHNRHLHHQQLQLRDDSQTSAAVDLHFALSRSVQHHQQQQLMRPPPPPCAVQEQMYCAAMVNDPSQIC